MLAEFHGDQTVDVRTLRQWVMHFSSGTTVTPQNEECLDLLICTNWQITTRGLPIELNIGLNVLKTMMAVLKYDKFCDRCVTRMLTQEEREHFIQVCQDLLNQYKTQGDSFLDHIIMSDDRWHHYSKPE